MAYNPTTWVNDQTPLSAGNMNKIEQGIKAAHDAIDAHLNDTADAHDASAISYAGGTGMSATNVEAAIDELAIEKGSKDAANTWTQRQTFAAGIVDGGSGASVSLIYSVQHQAHNRSTVLTYTNDRLTKVEEKYSTAVVKTTTLNYDGNGRLSSVVETAGGITRTSTLNYDGSGNLISITRS